MAATTLADLCDLGNVGIDRILGALRVQSDLELACAAAIPAIGLGQLAAAVQAALPDALDVEIGAAVLRRWWPTQICTDGSFPSRVTAVITLASLADLELPRQLPHRALRLRADLQIQQERAQIVFNRANSCLCLGEPRSWHVRWQFFLNLSGANTVTPLADGQRDVHLQHTRLQLP